MRPPTACKHTVSGTISLPSPGFFSPFPHGTGSLSVTRKYLALRDGPRRFPRDFTCPAVLRNLSSKPIDCRLPGCHRLWPIVPDRSTSRLVYHSPALRPNRPYNPGVQAPRFGLFRVRSPLLAESLLFSIPAGTEMVHFPALPSTRLCIQHGILQVTRVGFPIRKSPGQSLLAAHRGLSQLATSFIDCWCQGIHRTPLVA